MSLTDFLTSNCCKGLDLMFKTDHESHYFSHLRWYIAATYWLVKQVTFFFFLNKTKTKHQYQDILFRKQLLWVFTGFYEKTKGEKNASTYWLHMNLCILVVLYTNGKLFSNYQSTTIILIFSIIIVYKFSKQKWHNENAVCRIVAWWLNTWRRHCRWWVHLFRGVVRDEWRIGSEWSDTRLWEATVSVRIYKSGARR